MDLHTHLNTIRDEVAQLLALRLSSVRDEVSPLQRSARALRQAESIEQWMELLVDGASAFADRVVLFGVEGDRLVAKAIRGASVMPVSIPLSEAPAFVQVCESKEPVVCLRSASQISEKVLHALGETSERRVHLMPVVGQTRVLAIIYAEGEAHIAALEVLTILAAGSLELRKGVGTGSSLVVPATMGTVEPEHHHHGKIIPEPVPAPLPQAPPVRTPAPWENLDAETRALHLQAQRAARVAVAKLLLEQSSIVSEARGRRNLYAALRIPFLQLRAEFRNRFFAATDTMVDYLHLEALERLALGDEANFGTEYPGPLVRKE